MFGLGVGNGKLQWVGGRIVYLEGCMGRLVSKACFSVMFAS